MGIDLGLEIQLSGKRAPVRSVILAAVFGRKELSAGIGQQGRIAEEGHLGLKLVFLLTHDETITIRKIPSKIFEDQGIYSHKT